MGPDPRLQRIGIARDLTGRVALFISTNEGESFDLVDHHGRRYFRGQGWSHEHGWRLVLPSRVEAASLTALMAGTWFVLEPRERALVQAWVGSGSDPWEPLTSDDYLVDDFIRHLCRYMQGRGTAPLLVHSYGEALDLVRALRLRRHALLRD